MENLIAEAVLYVYVDCIYLQELSLPFHRYVHCSDELIIIKLTTPIAWRASMVHFTATIVISICIPHY